MPESRAPGVYVEETGFRVKPIEGVPTGTAGFAGLTRFGPVQYAGGPERAGPRLVTSFAEFERAYGGLDSLAPEAQGKPLAWVNYTAHAAYAFFANGGRELYISRVFKAKGSGQDPDYGTASLDIRVDPGNVATWRARWPGAFGNVRVNTQAARSDNRAFAYPYVAGDPLDKYLWGLQALGAQSGAVVEVTATPVDAKARPKEGDRLDLDKLYVVEVDGEGRQWFLKPDAAGNIRRNALNGKLTLQFVELRVNVTAGERVDVHDALACAPDQARYIGRILGKDDPEDENAIVYLKWDGAAQDGYGPARLAVALQTATSKRLAGGHDGAAVTPDDLGGRMPDVDFAGSKATGLEALGAIDDIAMVALPDSGALDAALGAGMTSGAAGRIIAHAHRHRYRIAVIDAPRGSSPGEMLDFRRSFDSAHAALYHPWVEVLDPLSPPMGTAPRPRIMLPPCGFVCGIYARADTARGVYKAPPDELVRGLSRFEANLNKGVNDTPYPEGVNCLRFFEGRGSRVWAARTLSSDPVWKYVHVRRLLIYIEHSIDKATRWAVFEPNGDRLWSDIRGAVEDFLLVLWRGGALLGERSEQAFYVRCDRTTMTRDDLDSGRMICLVGVAPTQPAEFIVFRIGLGTADSRP